MNAEELVLVLQKLPESLRTLPVTFVGHDMLYSVEVSDVTIREDARLKGTRTRSIQLE